MIRNPCTMYGVMQQQGKSVSDDDQRFLTGRASMDKPKGVRVSVASLIPDTSNSIRGAKDLPCTVPLQASPVLNTDSLLSVWSTR